MKKKLSKKKIALSVTSVVLVVAILAAFVPSALASTDRSLEYIELLKQKNSFKILEIAPSENDGVIGYYIKDSEPIANWKERAAMLTSPDSRESYVNNDVNKKLLAQGVMSTKAEDAPLYLEELYDEYYPWEITNPEKYSILELDADESIKVKGRVEETTPGEGDYVSNDSYVPVENFFENYFDYSTWRTTLGETLREKLDADYEVDKFTSSKLLSVNKGDKSLTVFGSTETNWSQQYAVSSAAVLYDLAEVYENSDYYAIEMQENKDMPGYYQGGSFVLSLDAKVWNGKGQVSIVPYDENGNIVKYSPNISKQYWFRQETVKTGHYEFRYTVPENSRIKYIQIKFDIDRIEASATFTNINVYKYNKNYFEASKWQGNGSTIINNNGVITVRSNNSEPEIYSATANKQSGKYYIECDKHSLYSLTYHTEIMPGGGKSRVYVYGYDESGNLIGGKTSLISEDKQCKKDSGTYTVDFETGNAKYLAVVLTFDTNGISGERKAYYSHVSLTKSLDYKEQELVATHRQVIDHFNSGEVGLEYGSNIFNFHEWYSSGSYNKSSSSEMSSSVVADESNGIINITNKASTATSDVFRATNNMYYIPVDDASEYHLSFTVNSSSTDAHTATIIYCGEDKSKISSETFYFTPRAAGPDEYSCDFTTLTDCRWLQISFGNTVTGQRNVFSSISLRKNEAPKVYYYSLIFTKVPSVSNIESLPTGTPLYTPTYTKVGTGGSFTDFEDGEKYYTYDSYSQEYILITDTSSIAAGTDIYKFSGVYSYYGNVGDEGLTYNIKSEYYTAEINYDGFTLVSNPSSLGVGTVYYMKDDATGEYYTAGIVNDSTVFDSSVKYYVNSSVIKETYDELHPYWVVADKFEPADDDTALFTSKSDGYKYVGEGKGDYKFVADPAGGEEMIFSTPLVYYKGGMKNNEWFKKGVLNCNEEELSKIAVSVTTVTTTYLNSLLIKKADGTIDDESLVYFLQGYELFVFSYGGVEGNATYKEDIDVIVRNDILKEANDSWETVGTSGEKVATSQYKIPVMIDNRICSMTSEKDSKNKNFANLPGLANDLCVDITSKGGVNKYIYKYDNDDIGINIKSIVNSSFLSRMKEPYTDVNSPYYAVYKEIVYENFIRSANKDKYSQLDTEVTEAAAIRYILNYRGQRIQHYKEKIRILEIQPYTEKSDLLEADGSLKTMVKQWFSPTGDLTYVNENNEVKEIDIEVTTMALGELAAKNGSIVENNDVIYIGSSLRNFDIVANHATGGTQPDDEGHIVPDYEDNALDGVYYSSTGDTVATGLSGGKRAPLAGLVGNDYFAFRDIEILGKKLGSVLEGGVLDLWYIDDSNCTLRKSGNDMTVNIKEQLELFANSGRPIIYSDDLVENEFVGEFKVNITYGIEAWDEDEDLPIMRFIADLDTNGEDLPEGVQPSFEWFCQSDSGLDSTTSSISKGIVLEQDIDNDGINESIYQFIFKEGTSLRGYGDYYAKASFKFSKSKYKGLREIDDLRSQRVGLTKEDIEYSLYFKSGLKHNLKTVEAVLELNGDGYMPNLKSNGGQNFIFDFVWKSCSRTGGFGQKHTESVTYSPDPFTPGSGYNPYTDRKITTTVTFDESRYGYELSLYVDAADDDDPTLQINYSSLINALNKEKDTGTIRYYKFNPKGDGTTVVSESGIALNKDCFDNSSYTYECMTNVFKNNQNIFSETMLNMNKNLERNNLLKFSNLSAPEIVVTQQPICYPNTLSGDALEFKFKILNYTDDTIATARYRYEFYVDNNSDGKFSANELTDANVFGAGNSAMEDNLKASTLEKINEYKFYKKFPASTAGIVPWKFIIIKVGDKVTEATTHNSITNYAYIKPSEATQVTAVQILPANWQVNYRRVLSVGDEKNHQYSDVYRGSVFLSDIFVSDGLIGGTDHLPFARIINYGIYSGNTFQKNVVGRKNAKYDDDLARVTDDNPGMKVKPISVDFTVGTDFVLNVSFKSVSEINEIQDQKNGTEILYNELKIYDMLILGFGDSYGRHEQDLTEGVALAGTNEGFQQGSVKAIERLIDDGKATLFCHDTAYYSNNFVSYIANDIANWISQGITKIVDFFKTMFGGDETISANLHASRVKQGYYLNIGLRDKLGLDRYGVTKNIKDRIIGRDKYNTYNDIEYNDKNLRNGHDYSTIYYDARKSDTGAWHKVSDTFTSEMIWNLGETMTVGERVQEFLDGGYDIAYAPNKNREYVDVFFHGYTDFVIEKFRKDDGVDEQKVALTNKITQVNSGQITNYPYEIDTPKTMVNDRKEYGTLDIMPTHDQVYQVSLQTDENGDGTTVWYCLANTDTKFDNNYNSFRNNATNGYFIYTHKNVTYTGSGHSNMFTESEAKLFINTIVAAYRIVADKPMMNFVKEDGSTIITHKALTTVKDGDSMKIEDDKLYFKVKDTSVDSEVVKTLGVKFYLNATPTTVNGETTYTYSNCIAEMDNVRGNRVTTIDIVDNDGLDRKDVIYKDALKLTPEGDDDYNEVVIYAVPSSTSTGFAGEEQAKTVYGDHTTITLRELTLRSLV